MEIAQITFVNGNLLWFLLFIPVLIAACVYNLKLKRKEALLFSNFESLEHVVGDTLFPSYFFQITLRLSVFLLLVFAASGLTIWYVGPSSQTDLAVLVDVSSSMSASDTNLSRLELAKEAASSIIGSLPTDAKVALISFAGTPFVEQPLTEDLSRVKAEVNKLNLNPFGGTDIGSALVTAANTLSISERQKTAILITDGSSTVGLPLTEGVDFLNSNYITVHTIGIGTAEGGNIMNMEGEDKEAVLDEAALKSIAGLTHGTYTKITNSEQAMVLYSDIVTSGIGKVSLKLSPLLLSAVILLIGLEWLLSFTTFSRIP